jgi:AcrR family transcriptional regulator
MSKATFYEHFANKEECILALFDEAAAETLQAMAEAASAAGNDSRRRMEAGAKAFLTMLAEHPNESQTLLVEIIGAGERGAERRDNVFATFAQAIDAENAAAARKRTMRRFASPADSYAIVGAVAELASRQLRKGEPADVRELEPLVERLIFGLAPLSEGQ